MVAVHTFGSSGEAYDASQTRDEIKDGDVLFVPSENALAIVVSAWPTAVDEELAGDAFHVLSPEVEWSEVPTLDGGTRDYSASVAAALLAAA